MYHYNWNDWYSGWGWILWFGIVLLFLSNVGNWGYSYRAHQKFATLQRKEVTNILDERYARGEINREEYTRMKSDLANKMQANEK